eukprot:gene6515-7503_t
MNGCIISDRDSPCFRPQTAFFLVSVYFMRGNLLLSVRSNGDSLRDNNISDTWKNEIECLINKNRAGSQMSQAEDSLKELNLSQDKLQQTLKNRPIVEACEYFVQEAHKYVASLPAGVDKVLFNFASTVKMPVDDALRRRARALFLFCLSLILTININMLSFSYSLLVKYLFETNKVERLETPEQIADHFTAVLTHIAYNAAAIKFVNTWDTKPLEADTETKFREAWGCGQVITEDDIRHATKEIIAKEQEMISENGWGYLPRLIAQVKASIPLAPGKLISANIKQQLTAILGNDQGDSKKNFRKKLKDQKKIAKLKQQPSPPLDLVSPENTFNGDKEFIDTGKASDDSTIASPILPWLKFFHLQEQFGSQHLTQEHLDKNIFFSHRDFDLILEKKAKGEPIYLYTGRGPSSEAMHLGHLIPFLFTKYLQDAFDLPLVIQMTDDEKFLFKRNLTLDDDPNTGVSHMCKENIKDIIAVGFDPDKTFIFSDLQIMGGDFYKNVVRFQRCVTLNQAIKIFDFNIENNIGQISFCAIQAVPSFPSSFPGIINPKAHCLIPCAIDQDPYFRLTRDVAPRLGFNKPALLHSVFFPAMTGGSSKMSSSVNSGSSIFLTDDGDTIRNKVFKYAFSGAPNTLKEYHEKGADLDLDISYQYLRFFMEDDSRLQEIGKAYSEGNPQMSTAKVKEELTSVLQKIVADHQHRRAQVSDEDIAKFTSPHLLA